MSTAFAIGLGTKNTKGEWLEVYYQAPLFQPSADIIAAAKDAISYEGGNQAVEVDGGELEALAAALEAIAPAQAKLARACTESQKPVVITILESDIQSESTPALIISPPS